MPGSELRTSAMGQTRRHRTQELKPLPPNPPCTVRTPCAHHALTAKCRRPLDALPGHPAMDAAACTSMQRHAAPCAGIGIGRWPRQRDRGDQEHAGAWIGGIGIGITPWRRYRDHTGARVGAHIGAHNGAHIGAHIGAHVGTRIGMTPAPAP